MAEARGVSHAQITRAWSPRHLVVAALIVGALRASHIDEAVTARSVTLTDDEAARLEAACTPGQDHQGVSNPTIPARAAQAATGFTPTTG